MRSANISISHALSQNELPSHALDQDVLIVTSHIKSPPLNNACSL